MQVLYVEPGSAADRARVLVGDRLQTIDDVSFATDIATAKRTIHERIDGTALKLKLTRQGQELNLEISPSSPRSLTSNQVPQPSVTPVLPPHDYV